MRKQGAAGGKRRRDDYEEEEGEPEDAVLQARLDAYGAQGRALAALRAEACLGRL